MSSSLFGRGMLYAVVSGAQLVSGAVISPVLAHLMGDPAEFGSLASAIALHQLLVVVVLAGLDQAILLQRAEDGDDRAAGSLTSAGVLLATGLTVLLAVTMSWWAGPLGFRQPSPLLTATIVWTIPAAAVMMLMSLLLGGDRLRPYSIVSLIAAIGGQVVGLGLMVAFDARASTYLWGVVVADGVAVLVGLIATRPAWFRLPTPAVLRRAVVLGIPLMLGSVSSFVLNAGDRVIIQRLVGSAEVGRYQVAYTVGFVAVQVVVLLGNSWLPRFAAIQDVELRRRLIGHSRDQVYLLLAPVVLGMTLAAPVLLQVFAPANFRRETLLGVVFLVIVAAYPVAASGASGRMLMTDRRVRPIAIITAVTALVNVVLNFLLVPHIGILGAAGATAAALVLQAVLQRVVTRAAGPWPSTPKALTALCVGVLAIAWATTLAPQTDVVNAVRFTLGLACLPWLWWQFRRVRAHPGIPG